MKKIFLSLIAIVTVLSSMAQQKDPKAKAILDAASTKFKSFSTVSAGFSYQIQNSAGKVLSKKDGKINMKGNKFNIDFGGTKIISDGKTVWNYDPSTKEVTVNNADNSTNTITPQKLFSDFYNKDFMYVMGNETAVGGQKADVIIMQPTDKTKPLSRLYLAVNKANHTVSSVNVVEKNGNRYVYTISNLKPNLPLGDDQFTFNKTNYPGAEVVDLR